MFQAPELSLTSQSLDFVKTHVEWVYIKWLINKQNTISQEMGNMHALCDPYQPKGSMCAEEEPQ